MLNIALKPAAFHLLIINLPTSKDLKYVLHACVWLDTFRITPVCYFITQDGTDRWLACVTTQALRAKPPKMPQDLTLHVLGWLKTLNIIFVLTITPLILAITLVCEKRIVNDNNNVQAVTLLCGNSLL